MEVPRDDVAGIMRAGWEVPKRLPARGPEPPLTKPEPGGAHVAEARVREAGSKGLQQAKPGPVGKVEETVVQNKAEPSPQARAVGPDEAAHLPGSRTTAGRAALNFPKHRRRQKLPLFPSHR